MRSKFKDEHPFGKLRVFHDCLSSHSSVLLSPEKRKAEAERIRQKYPDRIPVSIILHA